MSEIHIYIDKVEFFPLVAEKTTDETIVDLSDVEDHTCFMKLYYTDEYGDKTKTIHNPRRAFGGVLLKAGYRYIENDSDNYKAISIQDETGAVVYSSYTDKTKMFPKSKREIMTTNRLRLLKFNSVFGAYGKKYPNAKQVVSSMERDHESTDR